MTSGGPASGSRDPLRHIAKLARQSALLLSTGAVSYAASVVLLVLLARVLGQSGFGAYAVAFTLAKTLSILGMTGADWLIIRQGSYYEGLGDQARLRQTVYLALAISGISLLVLGGAVFILASWIAVDIFDESSLTPLLRGVSLAAPAMGLSQLMLFGTQAFKTMSDFALIHNILQPLVRLLFVTVAILWVASPLSAMVGLICAEVCILFAATLALNRRLPLIGSTASVGFREQIHFALPNGGIRLAEQTRGQAFPLLLGSLAEVSAGGVYVASQRLVAAPSLVIAAMVQAFRPVGSDLFLRHHHEDFIALFKTIGKWSFTLAWPLFCLQVLFPGELLAIFGPSFKDSAGALVLLSIAMLLNYGTGPTAPTLVISGRPQLLLVDYVVVVVVEVALSVWLIPTRGVLGAAVARLIGGALLNGLVLLQVWMKLGVHPYRFDYVKPLMAGVAAAGLAKVVAAVVVTGSDILTIALAAVVIGTVYLGVLLWLGLGDEDSAAIGALLSRARAGKAASQ